MYHPQVLTLFHFPYVNSKIRWIHFGQKKNCLFFFQQESFVDKQLSITTHYSMFDKICWSILYITPLDLDHENDIDKEKISW